MEAKWAGSGMFGKTTWSVDNVRALIRVWSDERVCKQLESSTRKRDIFVQISNRLMQQGIERDWKQCHTKYKNLKYLYRSLQRGRTEETDPRRLMRFYDEVDAIMTRTTQGSPNDREDNQADSERLLMMEDAEENDHIHSSKMNTYLLSHICLCIFAESFETGAEKGDNSAANRGIKRKAVDHGMIFFLVLQSICKSHEVTEAFIWNPSPMTRREAR
uniref:Myb/SANT-like DNA-binding domain-containing protein n=1 Tax=Takifugu rubripes TaxID=31033 RepID=A0A674MB23_TAKRU